MQQGFDLVRERDAAIADALDKAHRDILIALNGINREIRSQRP